MELSFEITRPKLKVFSAICTNFVVIWLGAMLVTKDFFALTINFLFAIVSLDLAVKAETLLEEV